MVVSKIVGKLNEIGFSDYEAKAYIALLRESPSTSYEVAKKSGIPTSKIYGVLDKLLSKSVIIELYDENKKKYIPKDPDELITSYKHRMNSTLDELTTGLSDIKKTVSLSYIWNIKEYDYLIDKACRMISEAKNTLLISIWPEELRLLKEFLKEADMSGLKIAIVHFGKAEFKYGQIFQHPIQDTIYSEKGGRGLVLIKDGEEVLFGNISSNSKTQGATSTNKGFVTMAEDYIKHDIYIMKIIKRYDDFIIKHYGENYSLLRDIFSDEVIK